MDTRFKITDIDDVASVPPSTVHLRPNSVMQHEPFRAVLEAQDGVAAGCRRVVGVWGLGGHEEFHVPASGTPVLQVAPVGNFPDRETWRAAGAIRVSEVFPGSLLAVRVYYLPSGATQYEDPPGTWNPGGGFGAVQIEHTWTSGPTTDGPLLDELQLMPSQLADASAPTGEASFWQATDYAEILLRPTDYDDESTATAWAEGASVELLLSLRGAPRIVAIVVYEQPLRVVYDHDNLVGAVHGQAGVEAPQTQMPQLEPPDGASYEEHRFGAARTVAVATRQSELGPWLCQLVAWDESTQLYYQGVTPISVSSPTFVDVLDQAEDRYERDRPGWIVAAAHAQQHALSDAGLVLGGEAVVVPARVLLEAYLTGAANRATIRVQSGEFEWIDIEVDGVVPTTYEATGYLESQVTPDHAWATLQIFAMVDNDTVEIVQLAVEFGP
jgi:hypothetical protein